MTAVELRWTTELTPDDYADLASLFDSEYVDEWGPWNPKRGYGFARGELHALARLDGQLLGYAASARRFVGVGSDELVIAGTGGVLTRKDARGAGVGNAVLSALQSASRGCAPADFGFLGCREEVVPFYESCGYVRIHSLVLDVSPRDAMTLARSHGPTMICGGVRSVDDWPEGAIDLRGLPW
jgi:aminoglycoside 2'-N-acetyltransferase I